MERKHKYVLPTLLRMMRLLTLILVSSLQSQHSLTLEGDYSPNTGLFKAKFSQDAQILALFTVGDDIKLIDLSQKQVIASLSHSEDISDIDLSANGQVLLVCNYQENWSDCRYYQPDSFAPIMDFRLEERVVHARVSADGRYLVGINDAQSLLVFDVAQALPVAQIDVGSNISTFDFADDLSKIVIGTMTGHYHLWDLDKGKVTLEDDFGESIHKIVVNDNLALITGRFKDDLVINLERLTKIALFNPDNKAKRLPSQIISAAFHPILTDILAIARPAHWIELWDISTGKLLEKIQIPSHQLTRFQRATPLDIAWSSKSVLKVVTAQGDVFHLTLKDSQ